MSKDSEKLGLEEFGAAPSQGKDFEVQSQIGLQARNCSSASAYFHIVCCVAGTGTLGLPYAVREGGWISLLAFFITAFISTYTARLLVECLYYKPGHRLEEFPDVGEAAFGKFGRYFTKVFHYSVSLSCGCIYILLTGHNIYEFLDGYDVYVMSERLWILLSGVVVTLTFSLLKTLKEVVFLSAFGTISTLVCVIIVAIVGGIQYADPSYVRVETVLFNPANFPMAFATIAFSYGGNVIYPHVEATMRNPKAWNKTVFLAVLSITFMYVIMGACGYLYYGSSVASPILDSLPKENIGTRIALVFITLHVAFAAPIYLCSFSLEQERILKIDTHHMPVIKELLYRILFRGSVGIILTLIAMYIPHFSSLCGIFGAVSNCIMVFLIPVACHYKLFGPRNRPIWQHIFCAIIIFVGLFGLILGTSSAVKELIEKIRDAPKVEVYDALKNLARQAKARDLKDIAEQALKAIKDKLSLEEAKSLYEALKAKLN